MKRRIMIFAALMSMASSHLWAQLERSDEFHEKYKLSEVVVFSRHNTRAPLAAPGSFISKVTPHQWYDFGVTAGELTMKGGLLETTFGQFFGKWVVSEGLFAQNAQPTDEELYVMSNSFQRTISTARHFSSAFMPMKTVDVHHAGELGNMDVDFNLSLGDDITEEQWSQIRKEYETLYPAETLRKASESLKPSYDLLTEILDVENSEAYKDGSFKGFNNHDITIDFSKGKEPSLTASINDAGTVVDALVLQYYHEPDLDKVAFGKHLTLEQWQLISKIIHIRDDIRFSSPFVQQYVSKHQREKLAEELQNKNRKFFFMCGHDTNILNIMNALRVKEYETTESAEIGTPIGSKIVFEKWTDSAGNEYVGVNHVYQTVDQLRGNILLNLKTRPNVIPLQFEGMDANEDGLFPLDKMIDRLECKDIPAEVKNVVINESKQQKQSFTVSGVKATDSYNGIIVKQGTKYTQKK